MLIKNKNLSKKEYLLVRDGMNVEFMVRDHILFATI